MRDAPRPSVGPAWRRYLKLSALAVVGLVAVVLLVSLGITLSTGSNQVEAGPWEPIPTDDAAAIERLAEVIRLETVSPETPEDFDAAPFLAMHAALERMFPRVHATLEHERVADYSLMYRWQGSDPSLAPIILLAHMDVVASGDATRWTVPPFAGAQRDGFLWGRGSMDDKGNLMAILEAAEGMLATGLSPTRTVYLCFGHDEELAGTGAQAMAALLEDRGVEAELLVDEGTGILDGLFPGLDQPMAMVGLAEKGVLDLELRVETEGGHGSAPPSQTAVGILAAAVARIEAAPMPTALRDPFRQTLAIAGPEMRWPLRWVTTNLWLFEPVLTAVLAGKPTTAPTVRTTTAVTMIGGGVKVNVLPNSAWARINHRVNAGDSTDEVIAHVRAAIDDPRVELTVLSAREVSRISDPDGWGYATVARSLREVRPDILVAPGLYVAASDARYYEAVARDLLRISPFQISKDDVPRYHGIDERLAVADYATMIQFYARLLQAR